MSKREFEIPPRWEAEPAGFMCFPSVPDMRDQVVGFVYWQAFLKPTLRNGDMLSHS